MCARRLVQDGRGSGRSKIDKLLLNFMDVDTIGDFVGNEVVSVPLHAVVHSLEDCDLYLILCLLFLVLCLCLCVCFFLFLLL